MHRTYTGAVVGAVTVADRPDGSQRIEPVSNISPGLSASTNDEGEMATIRDSAGDAFTGQGMLRRR
jgi:hypothetical protein